MGKKIAVVLTDMFEDVEYTNPAEAFKDAGHELTVIEKGKGNTVTGKNGEAKVTVDASIDDVKPEDFDALFIPGGFSPDMLRADERFVHFAKTFMDEKKLVLTLCHGPQLLITARTLEGRKSTGFKSIRVDLENAGAHFVDQEVANCQDQLITSRDPNDLPAFNSESLRMLEKM